MFLSKTTITKGDGMGRRFLYLSGLSVAIVLSLLVAQGFGSSGKKHKSETVLCAVEKSAFKSALADKVKAAMDARGVSVTVDDLNGLPADNLDQYHTVVVLTTIKAGKPDGKVTTLIKKLNEKDKSRMILVCTLGKGTWDATYHGVDAISCASKTELMDSVTNLVVARLDSAFTVERNAEEQKRAAEEHQKAKEADKPQ
jgi:sulfite reductase alpha subunit-like flavoprotein